MHLPIVWFEREGGLRLGVVCKENERRLTIVMEGGQQLRLRREKLVHEASGRLDVPRAEPHLVGERLQALRDEQAQDAPTLDLDLLWSSLEDEASYTLAELAQAYLGQRDDRAVAHLALGLIEPDTKRLVDCLRLRAGRFKRVDEVTLQHLRDSRRREAEAREADEAFSVWFRSLPAEGGPASPPTPPAALVERLDALCDYALAETRSAHAKASARLARSLGLNGADPLLAELERLGLLPVGVNEVPQRSGVPLAPSGAELRAVDELLAALPAATWDEDLRERPTLAIDAPATREVDDALSAWEQDGVTHLAVHIARCDPPLTPGSPLDLSARRRGTTVYFSGQVLSMLPWALVEQLSLETGQDRDAVSLLARVGPEGQVQDLRFARTRVRVDERCDYEGGPQTAAGEQVVERLFPVAEALRQARRDRGALIYELPRAKCSVGDDGRIELHPEVSDLPANLLVSELMILYNAALAERLAAAGAPALYRTQPILVSDPGLDPADPLFSLSARRGLPPTIVELAPGPHRTMGVEAYLQATSPIRRYGDLVAQRQLLALLEGRPTLPRADVEVLQSELAKLERRARRCEDTRERYLVGRWLAERTEPLEGVVSRADPRRWAVWLPALQRELPCEVADSLTPPPAQGDRVSVRVEQSLPRRQVLRLEVSGPWTS
jgi:exoribonuclease II